MAVKPSRSEIESALAARAKPSIRRKATHNESQDTLLETTKTREQYVIGGSFDGVSEYQKKRARFGISTGIHYLNWIVGSIVLMIVTVFFWPIASEKSTKEIASIAQPVNNAAYSMESRVDVSQAGSQDHVFTRDTDIKRADGFREQDEIELKTRALLISAQTHIAKGQYITPRNGNAIADYKAVLRMDPRNFKARQGIESINQRFLDNAYLALKADNSSLATNLLQQLKSIDQESEATLEFSKVLRDWRQNRQISALLIKAEQAQQEDKMILPARDNALYYFQEVLDIKESNEAAIGGILAVAGYYINKANLAITAGHFEAANNHLGIIAGIEPNHPSITVLKEKISTAETTASKKKSRPKPATNTALESKASSPESAETKPQTPTTQAVFSSNRTPNKEAAEQAAFDRQYLLKGLEAYYQGNYETAAALLQPLADKGVSRAQFRIGYMYYLGRYFKKDRNEADRVIRAALPAIQKFSDEGRAWAQSDLGSLYEDGLVLPKDFDEANFWYRSSAEQGYPGAQTNLGIMYARGRGVSSNRKTAIEWFQRAAKQGDIAAKRNLESMGVNQ